MTWLVHPLPAWARAYHLITVWQRLRERNIPPGSQCREMIAVREALLASSWWEVTYQ